MSLSFRPLSHALGAEVQGIDLSQPLSNSEFDQIHRTFLERGILLFRDQKITREQHIAFSRRFGELDRHDNLPRDRHPDYPELLLVTNIPEKDGKQSASKYTGQQWHSDMSFTLVPSLGSLLRGIIIPPVGGDTMFTNMYLAYDTLSAPIKALIDSMAAIHDGEPLYRGRYGNDDSAKVYPRAEHPVVRTHPVTRRKALFVNRFFTTRIVGLSRNESDAILEMLFRHIETPEFAMRFRWQPGSVAFWDNRCVQHHALWDYYPHRRYGHRVTICGDKPY
jgi:taurine dioxygenase